MVINADLEEILAKALEETRGPDGQVNLAEIQRRTGVSRKRLRRWKDDGFHLKPDKRGRKPGSVKLKGYTEIIDGLLAQGIRNRDVVLRELQKAGFDGGRTIVGDYIASHLDLLPAPRALVAPQGEYTRRWYTESGDCYQMDWGFVDVEDTERRKWKCACFVMVCHHCGYRYIEFFPNSRQENLFIGMLHAFSVMGVAKRILTDNMKSVTLGRDEYRNIIWNAAYNEFQQAVGFKTDLCKVAHPFTKGKVERLVRYVKDNFIPGRTFYNCNELNSQALQWCQERNACLSKSVGLIPLQAHQAEGTRFFSETDMPVLIPFLAPRRKLAFDRFVEYEGRRYGVPASYKRKVVRVMRLRERLTLLDVIDFHELYTYTVDWAHADKRCPGQWDYGSLPEPEEMPTAPVGSIMMMDEETSLADTDDLSRFSLLAAIAEEAGNE